MARREQKRPTDAELEILGVLWELGPSTVRQVHEAIAATREVGYSTVLKFMQIMMDKGLLERDEDVRPQVYRPANTQRHTQKQMLGDLMERAFGGSPGPLVLQALSSRRPTAEERDRIRDLLDKMEQE
jgi:predicted transcriptional regulator